MTTTHEDHQIKPKQIEITIDGTAIQVRQGISLAHALYEHGLRSLHHSARNQAARGMFCGMGVCYECTLTVNGTQYERACMLLTRPGMVIETS